MIDKPRLTRRSALALGAASAGILAEARVGAATPSGAMIAVPGDPTADITVLQKVAHAMKGGEVVR